jgi:hypothetical protein
MDITEATAEWVQATETAAGLNDGFVTWQQFRPDWPPADGNQHAAYLEALAEMDEAYARLEAAERAEGSVAA